MTPRWFQSWEEKELGIGKKEFVVFCDLRPVRTADEVLVATRSSANHKKANEVLGATRSGPNYKFLRSACDSRYNKLVSPMRYPRDLHKYDKTPLYSLDFDIVPTLDSTRCRVVYLN